MTKTYIPSKKTQTGTSRRTNPITTGSPALDYELKLLRAHLRESSNLSNESPTLLDAAAILNGISSSLVDLAHLLQTHQALQSAGEPLAAYLEDALAGIARDMAEGD